MARPAEFLDRRTVVRTGSALVAAGIGWDGNPPTAVGVDGHPPASQWRTGTGAWVTVTQFADDAAAVRAHASMTALWHSPFGDSRTPPGLNRPIVWLSGQACVVTNTATGSTLPSSHPAVLGAWLEKLAVLLIDLHDSCAPLPSPAAEEEGRTGDIPRVATARPALSRMQKLADALAEQRPTDSALVPTHGNLSTGSVLHTADGLLLLDWERAALDHPARDLAHFGATVWADTLLEGSRASWDAYEWLLAAYRRRRHLPHADATLDFHRAAALARIAHDWARHRDRAALVDRVVAEAESILGRSAPRGGDHRALPMAAPSAPRDGRITRRLWARPPRHGRRSPG